MEKSSQENRQLVFIDDSGDPGFKGSASSSAFVMAGAVIVDSETMLQINQEITRLRKELGWRENEEFKFHKSSRKIKLKFLETVNKYDFQIYGVFIRKNNYPNTSQVINGERLYNWTIKELLGIVPLHEAIVKIDGKYGKKYKLLLSTYIRRELNINKKKIGKFDVQDSQRDNLIQLVDFIADSINRSLQADKTDAKDYIRIIKNKIIELKELDLDDYQGGTSSIPF